MRILLIRHGETKVNAKGLIHKTYDSAGLNKNGKIQAKNLTQFY